MKKITMFLILLCMNSLYLFSSDANYTFTNSSATPDDVKVANILKNQSALEKVDQSSNSLVIEFSKDWVENFRKQRTKELQLMHKELTILKSMLSSGTPRTEENINNINSFIKAYPLLIAQRAYEEKLSSVAFIAQYDGKWQSLVHDVKATNNRLSGIEY